MSSQYIGRFEDRIWLYGDIAVAGDFHYPEAKLPKERHNTLLNVSDSHSVLVLNGDFINSFPVSRDAKNTLREYCDAFKEVIYIGGNHEEWLLSSGEDLQSALGLNMEEYPNLTFREYYEYKNVVVLHGHRLSPKLDLSNADQVVIGHVHPATGDPIHPCALLSESPYRDPFVVLVCPAFADGISNFDYTEQNRRNDFIGTVADAECVKNFPP